MTQHRILIQLEDSKGLVYHISKIFYEYNLNIISNNEFVDRDKNKFFMRTVVSGDINTNNLLKALQAKLPKQASINVTPKKNHDIIIFATKESHALGDLLIRHESGELDANIIAVASNHQSLEPLVSKFNLPYHSISAEGLSKAEHEAEIFELLDQYENIDYLVLAKYMRILSPDFVSKYKNKIINIHHSFLPAFIGANPYKQAYNRGVKIIGATAHFVTDDLDEGPIIAQDTIHVDHAHSWKDMQALGKNVEKVVLANALKLLFEDRVFLHGNKTVIL
ncbi:formyltetrahydrofolate deformylase [Francisellaceae bacterium]|nr:formyltetrahydrofolate deformylase [Francisellaceae bacterium]